MARILIQTIFLSALLFLGACQAETVYTGQSLLGSWGGQSIALKIDGKIGVLEYDCAAGSINGPIVLDSAGNFKARGTHTPGMGGPAIQGQEPQALPADYWGRVSRDTLTLNVHVPSLSLTLGPFTLRQNAEARLFRCL